MHSPKIVFFGNERLATGVTTTCPVLTSLIEAGYEVCAVVTSYQAATSRKARELEIKQLADEHGIPVLMPGRVREVKDQLIEFGADVAVLVAFGQIIPQEIIDLFPHGIINLHPSILPKHRGPTPIESVILANEPETGVSIMQLTKEMDAGGIYGQTTIDLKGDEAKQQLADELSEIGSQMIVELLPEIVSGDVIALPQDDVQATYGQKIEKSSGLLDFGKPAEVLSRQIRAFAEWPKSRMQLADKEVVITAAYSVPSSAAGAKPGEITVHDEMLGIEVTTSSGSLWITKLKPAGKNEMDAAEFVRGYMK